MADEPEVQEPGEQESEPPSGGSSPLKAIASGVGILVLVIAGNVISPLITGALPTGMLPACIPVDVEALAASAESEEIASGDPPTYLGIDPPLVVTFEDQDALRFLQVSIQLMFADDDAAAAAEIHLPVLRNNLIMLLGGRTVAELTSREGKEALRLEARAEAGSVLKKATGRNDLKDMFFTSFVLQ